MKKSLYLRTKATVNPWLDVVYTIVNRTLIGTTFALFGLSGYVGYQLVTEVIPQRAKEEELKKGEELAAEQLEMESERAKEKE